MLDLNHLRCFVAVGEELHFRRAAARLNLSAQPLSRQVQLLEQILQTQLLERNSRSVSLTQTGRWLLPEARRIMGMVETATQRVRQVAAGERGVLRFAFTAGAAYSSLPTLLSRTLNAWPQLEFELTEMVTRAQVAALLADRLDVGLMRPPHGVPELKTQSFVAEPLLVAVPQASALAQRVCLAPRDLIGQPFIQYAEGEARHLHELVAGIFREAAVTPQVVHRLGQIHSILALVNSGIGCAFVPQSARRLRFESVVLRPLDLPEPRYAELVLAWKGRRAGALVERLVASAPH